MEQDNIDVYEKKIKTFRFIAKGIIVILFICFAFFILSSFLKNIKFSYSYYYKDGVIADKIIDTGALNIQNYYLKVKYNEVTDLVDTDKKTYYLCEKGQKIFVVYSESKNDGTKVDKLFLTDKDLNKYLDGLKSDGFKVNLNDKNSN